MSDYLQRLVRRAIPNPPTERPTIQEIRPSGPLVGSSNDDPPADFEIEIGLPGLPAEASPTVARPAQGTAGGPDAPVIQPANDPSRQLPAVSEYTGSQPGSRPTHEDKDKLSNTVAQALEPQMIPDLSSSRMPMPATMDTEISSLSEVQLPAQADVREPKIIRPDIPHALDIHPKELNSERWRPGPTGLSEMDAHSPVPEPVLNMQNLKDGGQATPQLDPPTHTLPELNQPQTETNRLTIGSITVEVLPAIPASPPVQQTVQVTRIVQANPARHGRSSKLKFGLGQM
jgi:hypothetical protein